MRRSGRRRSFTERSRKTGCPRREVERAQAFDEGAIGEIGLPFIAAGVNDETAVRANPGEELFGQARLANSHLAFERDKPALIRH